MRIESHHFRCGARAIPAATFAILMYCTTLPNVAEEVTLAWDANSEPDLAGYYIYYGETGATPSRLDAGLNTTLTVTGLAAGSTYVFYATAFNTANLESDPSEPVTYTIPGPDPAIAATPVLTPAGGTFNAPVEVTMSSPTAGARIHYTLDGTVPTTSSTSYAGPITISSTVMLSARAFSSGYLPSSVATAQYLIQVPTAAPMFNPPGGSFPGPVQVTISSATEGATIYYTLDGSVPSTGSRPYNSPITINSTATLSARAFSSGYLPSSVISAQYTIQVEPGTTVVFEGQDTTTQGTWQGNYGDLGYLIVGDWISLLENVEITPTGHALHIWKDNNGQAQALRKASGGAGIAAAWYSPGEFGVEIQVSDSTPRLISIYFLDWDALGRSQSVRVLNAATGEILDSRTVGEFQEGLYLSWRIQGKASFRLINEGPDSAVLSGIFVD